MLIFTLTTQHQPTHKTMSQKTKLAFILIIWSIATILVIQGCKKQDINNIGTTPPIINSTDTVGFISGTHWKIDSVIYNDTNNTSQYFSIIEWDDYAFDINKKFCIIKKYTSLGNNMLETDTGTWKYSNKKIYLYRHNTDTIFNPAITVDSMLIEKLDNNNLWVKQTELTQITKAKLIPKK